VGVSGIACFAAACTLRALESACAGTLNGPDEIGTRGEKANTIAFSMEFPTSTIELFVSIAASAGIASAFAVASAISICADFRKWRIRRCVVMGVTSNVR
jgi:hypothetical protein